MEQAEKEVLTYDIIKKELLENNSADISLNKKFIAAGVVGGAFIIYYFLRHMLEKLELKNTIMFGIMIVALIVWLVILPTLMLIKLHIHKKLINDNKFSVEMSKLESKREGNAPFLRYALKTQMWMLSEGYYWLKFPKCIEYPLRKVHYSWSESFMKKSGEIYNESLDEEECYIAIIKGMMILMVYPARWFEYTAS